MAQKPCCAQKLKNCRISISFPLAAYAARYNSPLQNDRELFESSKDSCRLLVCTEKKNFRDLGLEFLLGIVEMREGFAFCWSVFYDVITRTMSRNSGSNFGCILG